MRTIAALACLALAPFAWLAAASAIYCAGTDKMALYQFPFWQWLQAAPYWRLNWLMTVCVFAAAAVPTLMMLLLAYAIARAIITNRRTKPSLYGKTGWANNPQMKQGSISTEKRPF